MERDNIQSELQTIHHKYGTTEKANYEIEKLFNRLLAEQSRITEQDSTLVKCSDSLSLVFKSTKGLKRGDIFLWRSGMTERYEIHTFYSDAGYGAKTFTDYNEKDGSSMLVNYSGVCGVLVGIQPITEQSSVVVTDEDRSVFNNSIIKTRGELLFTASKKDNAAFIVTLNGYLVIPIETPVNEIAKMIKDHVEWQDHKDDCPCCGAKMDER